MTIVREVPLRSAAPPCDLPSPNGYGVGTVAECGCGRRWKLRRIGFTFKGWRTTVPTKLRFMFHNRTRNPWADIQGD